MAIILATEAHLKDWTDLAVKLFPDDTYEAEWQLNEEVLQSDKEMGYLYEQDGKIVAYMHLSVRSDYVNGTDVSPVVYIEAIYVLPQYRKQQIGRELIAYAEEIARQKGIKQIASDCFIDNVDSELFHKNCGFIEKERVICFAKNV
jgi:aminoglycoside 6'-N-acetyltransferase I